MINHIKKVTKPIVRKIMKMPFIHKCMDRIYFLSFPSSQFYWDHRYVRGGTSGEGSYNRLAEFKADILNSFVKENNIESVIEFGCGDGNQLSLAKYPKYIGFDVSPTAIKICKKRFAHDNSKSLFLYDSQCFADNHNIFQAHLTLSLDVIYHLIEDDIFNDYMKSLFSSSKQFVIIYSSNRNRTQTHYDKDREFTKWIEQNAPNWKLFRKIDNKYPFDSSDPFNTSKADFYFFRKL